MPLGFEPVVPVGASGLAPRDPEVVARIAICSEEGRRSSLLRRKDAGTPLASTLSGSVSRAAGADGVSLLTDIVAVWELLRFASIAELKG